MASNMTPELQPDEIFRLTRYKRAAEQLRALAELGIPAKRMRDNTVLVLRMQTVHPATLGAGKAPTLKSSRK